MTKRLQPPSRWNHFERFGDRAKSTPTVRAHAVLSSNDEVITIGYYPDSETGHKSVVPVPDNQTIHPGWFYNRSTKRFQREQPE